MRASIDRMKLFIGFLILLNFIYFLWPKDQVKPRPEYKRGNPGVTMMLQVDEEAAPPSFESPVPKIYDPLVKEVPAVQEINASFSQPEEVAKNVDAEESVGSLNDEIAKKSLENMLVKLDSAAISSDRATLNSEQEITNDTSEAKLEGNAQVEVLANVENLNQMSTEIKTETELEVETEFKAEVDSEVRDAGVPKCFSLGPFKTNETAKKILADIDAMGFHAVIHDTTEKQKTKFWVYLPPFPSRQEAVDAAEQLAILGIEDYFIISDGRIDNAISLGIFNRKADSDGRIKEINALGYTPKVEVRSKKVSIFWIDTQMTEEVDWVGFLNQRFPKGGVESRQRSCS